MSLGFAGKIIGSVTGAAAAVYVGVKTFCPWLPQDIKYLMTLGKIFAMMKKHHDNMELMIDIFEQTVKRRGENPFIIFEDEEYSFRYCDEQCNRVARTVSNLGCKRGDTIALLMYNHPAYFWVFLGLQKICVTVACINTGLRNQGLLHCIKAAEPKAIIVGGDQDLLDALREIKGDLEGIPVFVMGCSEELSDGFQSFDSKMEGVSCENIDKSVRDGVKLSDHLAYIYTSGTTGLPKPAIASQKRCINFTTITSCMNLGEDDRVYVTLPLFHTAGLMLGGGHAIGKGATMVLKKKFSASDFWEDCRKHNISLVIYIGELFRYLLAKPATKQDREHRLKAAFGNGLRRDIYKEVETRFGIPLITEFYASTEGNVGFFNFLNVTGACGRASPLLQKIMNCEFLKYDTQTETIVRGNDGLCVKARTGEPGLVVGKISKDQPFDGYKGAAGMTEAKYVRDVNTIGDVYFNTGDLLFRDKDFNVYFSDRIGDTFRWKGENVSTTEVTNVLSRLDFIQDACVYGVEVPGSEGRAGMAALLLKDGATDITEDQLNAIHQHCVKALPIYARPMFLRVLKSMEITATFKQMKRNLKAEGFDVNRISDKCFVFDKLLQKYVPVCANKLAAINEKTSRL